MCMKEILLDTSRTVQRTKLIRYSSELYLFRMTDMLLDNNLYMYWCVVVVADWLEHRTLNRENLVLNAAIS